jgi:hypothetical protein
VLQWYEDTPDQAHAIVINDEVSRGGKWGSVATWPDRALAHLLTVAGVEDDKKTAPNEGQTEHTPGESVTADVSTQTGDQGGNSTSSPTSDGGYTPSPAYSPTSDEQSETGDGQTPGCQVDCGGCKNRGCSGWYSDSKSANGTAETKSRLFSTDTRWTSG